MSKLLIQDGMLFQWGKILLSLTDSKWGSKTGSLHVRVLH